MATRKRIGELLVEAQYISQQQLELALANKPNQQRLGDYLISQDFVTEQQLLKLLEAQLGIPHISLSQVKIKKNILNLLPVELVKRANVLPIRKEGNKLYVAMADPMDLFALEEIRMATGLNIERSIAAKEELVQFIMKHYHMQDSMDTAFEDLLSDKSETQLADEWTKDSAIIRLVNHIISNAVVQRASDIHFDPQEKELIIRFRVDGVLFEERRVPKEIHNFIATRIKIMGNLNITEKRLPQDGRVKINFDLRTIDIRLSTIPTVYGEKIVMRILDTSNAPNNIKKLGFLSDNEMRFRQMIARPNGIVLITGPTGSGKSTTLYAALKGLNQPDVNIITVEDPVEYQLEGINQIQVNDNIGMTFATGLRAILRQDPDIVMLGEIRDTETAQIAVRASLTGHLVLSTLHTNSALEAVSRLVDMGIPPYLLTASVVGVVSQRLVRKICRDCREVVEATTEEKMFLKTYHHQVSQVYKGKGCPVCHETGYRGRIAIHEVIPLSRNMKEAIIAGANANQLMQLAKGHGYLSILEDGAEKVIQGITTVEQLLKVAVEE